MPYRDPTRRHEFAPEEIGHTAISPTAAWVLGVLLLATIALPPALDLFSGHAGRTVWARLGNGFGAARSAWRQQGFFAANRALLTAMDSFEDELEASSLLRERLLPPVQEGLTRSLGLGNEQAYVGRDGWLFYRPDIDHVTGKGFLRPRILDARRRGGEATESPSHPDPIPALLRFHDDLARRGIVLVLAPAPVKPMLEPQHFSRRYSGNEGPLHNPSWTEFRRRVDAAGIALVDLAGPIAVRQRELGEPLYLASDTHWTPAGVEIAAETIAERLQDGVSFRLPALGGFAQRRVQVSGRGDIAVMLKLPEGSELFPRQSVIARPVVLPDGGYWQPDPHAEVLLLGDSFSNIYSDPGLGWGSGAGLAERLAYHLQRPVDRIARNAGGAYATREELARQLRTDPRRLDHVKVVVYEFAARELSSGDWQEIVPPARPAG